MSKKSKGNRREEIIEMSALLFREKGYKATSTRDIAEKVGMEAASMYNYIHSKHEILETICFRVSDRYFLELTKIEASGLLPLEKVKAIISAHVKTLTLDGCYVSVTNNEWRQLKDDSLIKFRETRREYEKRVVAIIEEGVEAGTIKRLNVSVILFTLLSSLRWIEYWYNDKRGITPELLEENLINILINGISK
jgi:AcrR family transcriptional regulator